MRLAVLLSILCVASHCPAQSFAPPPQLISEQVALRDGLLSTPQAALLSPLMSDEASDLSTSAEENAKLQRFKKQALQSVGLSAGWLANASGSGLSSSFIEASIGSGIPLGSFDNIVSVTPRFRLDWIDSPTALDIPNQLYQFETQFFYRRELNQRWSAMGLFSPSIRSDLTTSDRAFRVFALALVSWRYIPDRLTLSGGAVFLGRADLPVLPAVGVLWTPTERVTLDARFPTSKLAYRIAKDGPRSEHFTYLSIGLGGNTWAVTRRSAAHDELSLRDLRLMVGTEKILAGGGGWFIEGGYAFNRRLEYENTQEETALGDAISLSGGWRY